jgi:hypothetical protein
MIDATRSPSPGHELAAPGRDGSRIRTREIVASIIHLPGVADWDTVRGLALSFPEVEASSSGRVSFSVRGKGFAWEARERDGGGLAVRVDRAEKQLFLDANPDVYFTAPHYSGYPAVQIRVEAIGREELRERLEDAWLIQAPKKLAAAYAEANA